MVTNLLLVGVGGQGIILAADVIARAMVESGYDVKLSEIHGMSQRGGSVHTAVRFGEKVNSPLIEMGEADHLIAFEQLEAVRWIPYLKPGGEVIVSDEKIKPLPVLLGTVEYPADPVALLPADKIRVRSVPAGALADEAGSRRSANIVVLGVLACSLSIDLDIWRSVIERRVPPRTIEVNAKAFNLGYEWAADKALIT